MIHRGLGPYAFVANASRTFSYLAPTLLFLCMAAGHSLFPQAISGSIGETVTDTTGDVIPGATVTVTDVNKPTENPSRRNGYQCQRIQPWEFHRVPFDRFSSMNKTR